MAANDEGGDVVADLGRRFGGIGRPIGTRAEVPEQRAVQRFVGAVRLDVEEVGLSVV